MAGQLSLAGQLSSAGHLSSAAPLAGVALAAGGGKRLRPLTDRIPKPLLEVGGATLLDQALERLASIGADPAVNAHHLAAQIAEAVTGRAYLSVERERALGTAGAIGFMRDWIDGRAVAVTNADAWIWPNPMPALIADWDGSAVRLAVVGAAGGSADFAGGWRYAGCCLLPGTVAAGLPSSPAGLWEVCWAELAERDELELVQIAGRFHDCGTFAELEVARRFAGDLPDPDPGAAIPYAGAGTPYAGAATNS